MMIFLTLEIFDGESSKGKINRNGEKETFSHFYRPSTCPLSTELNLNSEGR